MNRQFLGKNPVIMEIGVSKGGSLDMWNYYFEGQCQIYGVDIDPNCKAFEAGNITILIGDQSDPQFLKQIRETVPKIDIFLDDGSHVMSHLIATFRGLYQHVKPGGVYMVEDLHTAYWPSFEGGLGKPNTFIEYSKKIIDELNGFYIPDKPQSDMSKTLGSLHYYDSIFVIEKCVTYNPPVSIMRDVGTEFKDTTATTMKSAKRPPKDAEKVKKLPKEVKTIAKGVNVIAKGVKAEKPLTKKGHVLVLVTRGGK
jgi:23S rRNA U2552 (ribose-2'-O)-methylase RlmE/FtsJ